MSWPKQLGVDITCRMQISRKASKVRSPILHALFGGGEWEVLMLEAVLPDGRGLTQRRSLLDTPEQHGERHSRDVCMENAVH